MVCDRCHKPMTHFSMSYFNEDECCQECLEKERKHPMYEEAKRIEHLAVLRGNFNYPGIGLPKDLK